MDAPSRDERGTTERVLTLLGLLQQRHVWTGPELADRLGVTSRTVRRDVERLRTLGYQVHASQGVGGGYQLGPGPDMALLQQPEEREHPLRRTPLVTTWRVHIAHPARDSGTILSARGVRMAS
jgi:biotin operon repressor